MCPSAESPPHAELCLFLTDDQIIPFLNEYTPQSNLPSNVLADWSPYQYPPSNLPEGIWYLVPIDVKKEYVHGFWKANAEDSRIYSNSTITGWRTTLHYFEGQAPDEQRTDWRMHEYWITRKELYDKDKPKESRLLCRVFCNDKNGKSENPSQNYLTTIEPEKINFLASIKSNADVTSGEDCGSESKAKEEREVAADNNEPDPEANRECEGAVADNKPNSSGQVFSQVECFERGDFLELADLEDNVSHSSSSRSSSCLSNSSDEEFDVSAFLKDIEADELNSIRGEQSSSRYEFTSVRPDDIVLQPPPSGTLLTGSILQNNVDEGSQRGLTVQKMSEDEREMENATEGHKPDSSIEGTSNDGIASRERKPGDSSRMKKLKMCFCFKPF
ncbi:NAC domain class transcription factor [Striga asiatica]|uniref:NAC domain class transcription factor n=1 Tax=Striga asiatica TaxID=4170 RepID=A0A5A7PAU4_STRAF|nr:NAC domain class transcription factor [Striga asiatica]